MDSNNHQDRRRNGQYYREGNSSRPGQDRSQYYYGNGQQYYGGQQGNSQQYYGGQQNNNQQYYSGQQNNNQQYYGGQQYYNGQQGNQQYYGGTQNSYGGGDGSGGGRKNDRKKKKRSKVGDVLSGLLMLVALGVFLYSGYTLYGFYKDYKAGTDEYNSLAIYAENDPSADADLDALENETGEPETEPETMVIEENGEEIKVPVMKNPVDFEELQKVNEDIVGWIKIRSIDISYPIVQGEDNEYYLHRTFEKEDNFAGCIFMNYSNKDDFTDQNTIIYGHNMKNGSMFGKLKKFQEDGTYEKSEYFWIYTPDVIYQYHIFSAMTVNKTGLTYQTFYLEDDFQKLINTAFENSVVDNSDLTVTTDDRIVTLSTCTGDDSTRFVVMGKLEQIYGVRK